MNHKLYIRRCIDLASLSGHKVGLNPNVGSVLVHENKIIGEGYYEKYGGPHAEVNAIESVPNELKSLIPESTLYVSLEPCNIHGKTPPCSSRILKEGIKKVVVGCTDPNPKIAGSSVDFLQSEGVDVTVGILEDQCKKVIRPFATNILEERPYITLKWAQSSDNYIGKKDAQVWLSNKYSKIFSHKLRTDNDAILIGTATALIDNPSLTSRQYLGSNPLRIVIDRYNKIPITHHLLADEEPLLILNLEQRDGLKSEKEQWSGEIELSMVLRRLYAEKRVGRMIVEGGSKTIMRFVKDGLWDRALVIKTSMKLEEGVPAPRVTGRKENVYVFSDDVIYEIRK